MKAALSKIPAPAWLVVSYALIGGLLYWSGNHEPTQLSASVFFMCLLGSWIPAYVYANRRDMVQNKVFWVSQGVALAAAVMVTCLLGPWIIGDDSTSASVRQTGSWKGIIGGVFAYIAVQAMCQSIVRSSFDVTESTVEKLMTKKPREVKR